MKEKWKKAFLCLAIILLSSTALFPSAQAAGKKIAVYLNQTPLQIPVEYGAPFYDENNRLQIPMRYILESCGYEVIWNNNAHTATVPTLDGNLVITIGSREMRTPDGIVTMDTAAVIKESRTYLPLRFVLEALDFRVDWTGGEQTDRISITGTPGEAGINKSPMSAAEVSAASAPAVLYVEVKDADGVSFASGSGFFIHPDGIGVTNYHVIDGAYSADLITSDGVHYTIGDVIYYDEDRDLVIFQAITDQGKPAHGLPYLRLANPEKIRNGDPAFAIGSPHGYQNSITDGLVSNADRAIPGLDFHYIQTSAPISPGNSGGPLLNQYGEVIGVNTASRNDSQNINLAIPVADILSVNYRDRSHAKTLAEIADLHSVTSPTNVRLVGQDADGAYIQWDPVPGADYYYFYSREQGEAEFSYNEDPDYYGPKRFQHDTDYSVWFNGLDLGFTYEIQITAVQNGVESAPSSTFSFTYDVNDPGNSGTPYYSDAWWLPDFGALYGVAPDFTTNTENGYVYLYDLPVNPYVESYINVLKAEGYRYDPLLSAMLKEDSSFIEPICFLLDGTDISVTIDIDATTADIVIITVF